jgi:hypothetical protein
LLYLGKFACKKHDDIEISPGCADTIILISYGFTLKKNIPAAGSSRGEICKENSATRLSDSCVMVADCAVFEQIPKNLNDKSITFWDRAVKPAPTENQDTIHRSGIILWLNNYP